MLSRCCYSVSSRPSPCSGKEVKRLSRRKDPHPVFSVYLLFSLASINNTNLSLENLIPKLSFLLRSQLRLAKMVKFTLRIPVEFGCCFLFLNKIAAKDETKLLAGSFLQTSRNNPDFPYYILSTWKG